MFGVPKSIGGGIPTAGLKERVSVAAQLNASFMYLGFSLGASIGGTTLARWGVANSGFAGGAAEIAGLVLTLIIVGRRCRAGVETVAV